MIYTKDSPKSVDLFNSFKGSETFTGVVKDKSNNTAHYLNGKIHRTDGPAVERAEGDKLWCLNGKLHREGGPAIEYPNGDKQWYLNGKHHREDGPAVEYTNGDKEWYLNGKLYGENDDFTNESWIRFVKLELLK